MILVTGATGFVGTHLLIRLAKEQQPIRALYRTEDKRAFAQKIFLRHLTEEGYCSANEAAQIFDRITWTQTTLEDIEGLRQAFQDIQFVYHCAAFVSFDLADYKQLRKTNIDGTATIVNLCIQYQIQKLCYVSSIATLGAMANEIHLDETAAWNPEVLNSIYAITKYGAELEVWRGSQEGLDVVIVNPGVIIGTGFYQNGSGTLFTKIHKGLSFYTKGSTGFVGVQDVTRAMILLTNGSFKNERYILVSENLTYQDALTKIATALNKKPPTQLASSYMIHSYRILKWLGSTLFGLPSHISKATATSLQTPAVYTTTKIKDALQFQFDPMTPLIQKTATDFLNNYDE